MQDLKKTTELNCTTKPVPAKAFGFEASYLGTMDYTKAVNVQLALGNLAKEKNQISVIGLQHPTVITLGHRADEMTEILMNKNSGTIPIVRSSRGGLATIHSEGQLVIYPIMNLKFFKLGVRDYVFLLLLTTQDLLKKYNIQSKIDLNGAGLYTVNGKISFCGIQVHDGVTCHGISLNVRNDLRLFDMIRPCGMSNINLDSLKEYKITYTLQEIYSDWITCFQKNLQPVL